MVPETPKEETDERQIETACHHVAALRNGFIVDKEEVVEAAKDTRHGETRCPPELES